MTYAANLKRRLDRSVYRVLRALARHVFPSDVGAGPVVGRTLRSILVLPNYKVGDLVVATSSLSFLREVAPQARLDVLVSERNASLLAGDPRVDRVLLHDPVRDSTLGLARRLRRERYDLVIDLVLPHHLREGLLTAVVAGRSGARVTPFRPTRYHGFFTHAPRVPGFERRYMAERLLYAVQSSVAGGQPPYPDMARYPVALTVAPASAARVGAFLNERVRGRFVALNAWASDPLRTLGIDQAAALVAAVATRHPELAVVLTPPPSARDSAATIADRARGRLGTGAADRVAVFPPSQQLADIVALLEQAAVVITPDTGNVHLAAAVGRPVVALFTTLATERIAHWVPSTVPHRTVLTDGPRPLAELLPERVADAFDELWAELAAHPSQDALHEVPAAERAVP